MSNMTCRGICERHRAEKNRYTDNTKRCTSCNVYLSYDGIKCPCCGTQLRSKRKSKFRIVKTYTEKKIIL